MISEKRLYRETDFGLIGKLWNINWLYIVLLCVLAGVGYAALYSAAGGSPEPYAARHVLRFGVGLVLMLSIAMVDIRFIARLAWPTYAMSILLLVLVARSPARWPRSPWCWCSPRGSTAPRGSGWAIRCS